MSSASDLRTEDLLAGGLTVTILSFLVARGGVDLLAIDESTWWDYAMIVFPVALLVLLAAVRFAFRPQGTSGESALGRMAGAVRDWFPFVFFSFAYEAFRGGLQSGFAGEDADARLLAIDRALFGETPSLLLERFTGARLTAVMGWLYFSHILLSPLLALVLYVRDRRLFREFLLAFLICGGVGLAGYSLVPATGPRGAFAPLFHVPLGDQPFSGFVDAARAPRDAFPSLHAAISALVLAYAFRHDRRLGWALVPVVAGIWASTLYLRYHYAIDLAAGGLLAVASGIGAHGLLLLEDRFRRRPGIERPADG